MAQQASPRPHFTKPMVLAPALFVAAYCVAVAGEHLVEAGLKAFLQPAWEPHQEWLVPTGIAIVALVLGSVAWVLFLRLEHSLEDHLRAPRGPWRHRVLDVSQVALRPGLRTFPRILGFGGAILLVGVAAHWLASSVLHGLTAVLSEGRVLAVGALLFVGLFSFLRWPEAPDWKLEKIETPAAFGGVLLFLSTPRLPSAGLLAPWLKSLALDPNNAAHNIKAMVDHPWLMPALSVFEQVRLNGTKKLTVVFVVVSPQSQGYAGDFVHWMEDLLGDRAPKFLVHPSKGGLDFTDPPEMAQAVKAAYEEFRKMPEEGELLIDVTSGTVPCSVAGTLASVAWGRCFCYAHKDRGYIPTQYKLRLPEHPITG